MKQVLKGAASMCLQLREILDLAGFELSTSQVIAKCLTLLTTDDHDKYRTLLLVNVGFERVMTFMYAKFIVDGASQCVQGFLVVMVTSLKVFVGCCCVG
jgi:hypothetical protein